MKKIEKVTANCFIDEKGRVIFVRRENDKEKKVKLETIEDAISQNLHILENLFVEFVETYDMNWAKPGEFSEIRDVLQIIQEEIERMASGVNPKAVDLSHIAERFKNSRNKHKKNIAALLLDGPQTMSELTKAHVSAVKRIKELQGIIQGTIIQTKKLLKIREDTERKILYSYRVLTDWQVKLERLSEAPRKRKEKTLYQAARDIAGPKANKVIFTLQAAIPVNPYKERIESREIKKLSEIEDYFKDWKVGSRNYNEIIELISKARKKLKRIVRKKRDFDILNRYQWR